MNEIDDTQEEKILTIDGNDDTLDTIEPIFGSSHTILTSNTGEEGIAMAITNLPHIILLGAELPDMAGYEVCKRLKTNEETRRIPVVFLTEKKGAVVEVTALGAGASDFITKPVDPMIVEARILNHLSQKRQLDELEKLSVVDGLTGIPNRRRFEEYINQEWKRGTRSQYPISLLMIDIDYFKNYNDTYGHQQGDESLRVVAKEIQQHLRRPSDMVFRYGGEEFSVILPDTPLDSALTLAERIRSGVEGIGLVHSGSTYEYVTASIGIATKVPADNYSILSLIEEADRCLYSSKNNGRNCITGQRSD